MKLDHVHMVVSDNNVGADRAQDNDDNCRQASEGNIL